MIPLNEALDILKYIHRLKLSNNELDSTVGLILSKENINIFISLDKDLTFNCVIHNAAKTFSCFSQDEKDVLLICSFLNIHSFTRINFDNLLIDDNYLVPNNDKNKVFESILNIDSIPTLHL